LTIPKKTFNLYSYEYIRSIFSKHRAINRKCREDCKFNPQEGS
jgi:hypothetical protein